MAHFFLMSLTFPAASDVGGCLVKDARVTGLRRRSAGRPHSVAGGQDAVRHVPFGQFRRRVAIGPAVSSGPGLLWGSAALAGRPRVKEDGA